MNEHDQIKRAGGNDVSDWGEKDISGAYATPLKIRGLGSVDVNETAPLTDEDRAAQKRARGRKAPAPVRR